MDIVQTFYDGMAAQYDRLFADWDAAVAEQARLLDSLFAARGFGRAARILDCACGIGTQAIGLAALGYPVTGSDISTGELAEAERRAAARQAPLALARADFRDLAAVFPETFDVVICMDNALPHMLTPDDLAAAVGSMAGRLAPGGMLVASIRDYDAILADKPAYAPPYIHRTAGGKRVSFQTWDWEGERYRFTQYILEDGATLTADKFTCEYRAVRRSELTGLLTAAGCARVEWLLPGESGFYQPIVIARR